MRPSFLRVRSCVSSRDFPMESTLELTSPTLVRTKFFVAQAVEPPTVRTAIGIATRKLRMIRILLERIRARLPGDVAVSGSNDQVLVACPDHERMPARSTARLKCHEVLMAQLLDDLPRRRAALTRRARHE